MPCPTCFFVKADGSRCGSAALRGKKFCYHHLRHHKQQKYAAKISRELDVLGPRLPRLRTAEDVREALQDIIAALADYRTNPDRAGRHLFAIQQILNSPTRLPSKRQHNS